MSNINKVDPKDAKDITVDVNLKSKISNDDLLKQVDPAQYLVSVLCETNNNLIEMQSSVADTEQLWALGAQMAVSEGDKELDDAASAMSKGNPPPSGDDLTRLSAAFQVLQTKVSNNNQNFSNIVQGGSTAMNSLTQIESQELQLGSVATQNKDSVNSLLQTWGM